jgi:hypothetical protein
MEINKPRISTVRFALEQVRVRGLKRTKLRHRFVAQCRQISVEYNEPGLIQKFDRRLSVGE